MKENGQLTWMECATLIYPNRYVRFVEPHDIFDTTVVDTNTQATVVENSLNEMQPALILFPHNQMLNDKLKDWNGEIWLTPPDDEKTWEDTYSPLALVR